ncbi:MULTISPECIES: thiosulfate oxidation carrier protein SoxY [unclassified Yoonia]|uniref:thiosulfate oxidation carrier protein SoxY n=1 Tax=unclassified Yoonia TaxID=2629118 RepID=UPI002AFFCD63|nr:MULTISPECIES: thiosulfate oxidation carrier protein SoxY [unclassified Yoonia]
MTFERRTFIKGAASVALVLVSGVPLRADNHNDWQGWREQLLAGREVSDGTITLDLPAVAENGAQVPLTVKLDSPMTAEDHVTAIHIIATRNPAPQIGTFHLTPQMSRAEAMTRIRVAEEQEILVLAELSDGRVFEQTASIIVSVGGCAT